MNKYPLLRIPLKHLRDSWVVVGLTLILVIGLELSLSLAFLIKDRLIVPPDNACSNPRSRASAYENADWVDDYFSEYCDCSIMRWESYVYWRRKPYEGRYINIDAEGLRHTVMPGGTVSASKGKAPRIFMFGGSTLWGTGARDSETIPSLVARELAEKHHPAEITNFGELGYVTTQELIVLLQQLRYGNVPDLVVFYDGVNDTFSAYQQRRAGLPHNEFHREIEFNITRPGNYPKVFALAIRSVMRRSSIFRLASFMIPAVVAPGENDRNQRFGSKTSEETRDNLEKKVVDVYLGNMRIVSDLGKSFGFKTLFYWQPTIFGKKALSPWEQSAFESKAYLEDFVLETNRQFEARVMAEEMKGFSSLWDIFKDLSRPVYLDWCHVSEYGNGMIAERIAVDIAQMIPSRPESNR